MLEAENIIPLWLYVQSVYINLKLLYKSALKHYELITLILYIKILSPTNFFLPFFSFVSILLSELSLELVIRDNRWN